MCLVKQFYCLTHGGFVDFLHNIWYNDFKCYLTKPPPVAKSLSKFYEIFQHFL